MPAKECREACNIETSLQPSRLSRPDGVQFFDHGVDAANRPYFGGLHASSWHSYSPKTGTCNSMGSVNNGSQQFTSASISHLSPSREGRRTARISIACFSLAPPVGAAHTVMETLSLWDTPFMHTCPAHPSKLFSCKVIFSTNCKRNEAASSSFVLSALNVESCGHEGRDQVLSRPIFFHIISSAN